MSRRALSPILLVALVGIGVVAWWQLAGRNETQAPSQGDTGASASVKASAASGRALTLIAPTNEPKHGSVTIAPNALPLDCAKAEGLAATVNGRPITEKTLCSQAKALTGSTTGADIVAILLKIEEAELVAAALGAHSLTVSESEVDVELAGRASAEPLEQQLAREGVLLETVRAEVKSRIAKRRLVDDLGALDPTSAEIHAELIHLKQQAASPKIQLEGFIARAGAGTSADKLDAAKRAAEKVAVRLRRGEGPGETPLKPLPRFELTEGQGEPELEAALFRDLRDRTWQGPIRTRAGWVVVRTTGAMSEGKPNPNLENEARQRAAVRRRQMEEQRIVGELRENASIVRHVLLGPSPSPLSSEPN